MIATADPRRAIRRRQQGLDLRAIQELHRPTDMALARHGQDLLAVKQIGWLVQGHEPEEGPDGRQPRGSQTATRCRLRDGKNDGVGDLPSARSASPQDPGGNRLRDPRRHARDSRHPSTLHARPCIPKEPHEWPPRGRMHSQRGAPGIAGTCVSGIPTDGRLAEGCIRSVGRLASPARACLASRWISSLPAFGSRRTPRLLVGPIDTWMGAFGNSGDDTGRIGLRWEYARPVAGRYNPGRQRSERVMSLEG